MKVVDIRAYPLKTRTALVRVFTDDGTEGIGECSPMNVPVMCHFVDRPGLWLETDEKALAKAVIS